MKKLISLLILTLTIPIMAQVDLKPIPVTDEPTKKSLSDAYKALLTADKDFQIALLKAKLKYKIEESWGIDLQTMTFIPPPESEKKKEEKKDIK